MNNKRATKRALLTSVMALVMCVVMLVGTTFAWFTDTASTGVNKIQAGNLDVELFGRGFAWLDTGTMDSLVDAADFVRMVEKRLEAYNARRSCKGTFSWWGFGPQRYFHVFVVWSICYIFQRKSTSSAFSP